LPDEYKKLRQTFDTSGNNRIKDIISRYEKEDEYNDGNFDRRERKAY
jgi:hypothetical protein